jgi:cytochrome c peroxidase
MLIWPEHSILRARRARPAKDSVDIRFSAGFNPRAATLVAALLLVVLDLGCSSSVDSEVVVVDAQPPGGATAAVYTVGTTFSNEELSPRVLRRFAPLDTPPPSHSNALTDLGRQLYYDPRLSKTGEISCNSCHPLDTYGTTRTAVSTGINGRKGARNAPSTYNAAGHFAQLWDGRSPSVEKQAIMPIENQDEMGMTAIEVVDAIKTIAGYREEFARAFPGDASPITTEHIGLAIGTFERGLATPARWDRYLRGDTHALNAQEKAGAKSFANLGCIVCHTGPYVGGSMFERLGARVPWPAGPDHGRRQVTGLAADDMVFKVPSLRNVAMTAPYFHDGSAQTLNSAIRLMALHQLGVELEDDEANDLEAWLSALTGDIPRDYIAPPVLPPGA